MAEPEARLWSAVVLYLLSIPITLLLGMPWGATLNVAALMALFL